MFETMIVNIISYYGTQSVLPTEEKDSLLDQVISLVAILLENEKLLLCGDINGQVEEHSENFEDIHGGYGYSGGNQDGLRSLIFSIANQLTIANIFFKKNASRFVTYSSESYQTHVFYLLVRKSKSINEIKVNESEECINQHQLLIFDNDFVNKLSKVTLHTCTKESMKTKKASTDKHFPLNVNFRCQDILTDQANTWENIVRTFKYN